MCVMWNSIEISLTANLILNSFNLFEINSYLCHIPMWFLVLMQFKAISQFLKKQFEAIFLSVNGIICLYRELTFHWAL